jgi:hypothetical protein
MLVARIDDLARPQEASDMVGSKWRTISVHERDSRFCNGENNSAIRRKVRAEFTSIAVMLQGRRLGAWL